MTLMQKAVVDPRKRLFFFLWYFPDDQRDYEEGEGALTQIRKMCQKMMSISWFSYLINSGKRGD